MTKVIDEFTKENIKEVREIIQTKLNELNVNGLNIILGNISFDKDSFKSSIQVTLDGSESIYVKEFKSRYYAHCFKGDEVGKTFTLRNDLYKFLGFVPRKRVHIALIERISDGKKYNIDASEVLRFLTTK